jgi:hypothetical protein
MNAHETSQAITKLLADFDRRLSISLRRAGTSRSQLLDLHLRPIEAHIDEIYFEGTMNDRVLGQLLSAAEGLRALSDSLPSAFAADVDPSDFDRLRALATDLRLQARGC